MNYAITVIAAAFVCVSCGVSKGSDSVGREECKAVLAKGYQLQGTPEGDYAPLVTTFGKVCEEKKAISRSNYECGMKAKTLDQYEACRIVIDFR